LKCFLSFVLGKCSVNRPCASKLAGEDKLSKGIWIDQQWYSTCTLLEQYFWIFSGCRPKFYHELLNLFINLMSVNSRLCMVWSCMSVYGWRYAQLCHF